MNDSEILTSEAAHEALAKLHGDSRTFEILNDKGHPEYQHMVARRDALSRAAHPGDAAFDTIAKAAAEALNPPCSPDEYPIEIGALPPEYAGNDDRATARGLAQIRDWFHVAGMSVGEARDIMARFAEIGCDPKRHDPAVDSDRVTKCMATLRTLWGTELETELAHAKRAVRRLGGQRLAYVLEVTRLGNDPWVIRALADASKRNRW